MAADRPRVFENRRDAGARLADGLRDRGVSADLVVGVARGGLPVARPVTDALGVPLDVVVAKKLGAPGNPEFAIGAVAADGSRVLDDETVEWFGVDAAYVEEESKRAAATAREKADAYRAGDAPEVAGETVVVVDDGVATGATLTACLRMLRAADAGRLVVAVPVGAPASLADLEAEADAVIALEEPANFSAVGRFYRDFTQVTDEEARACLHEKQRTDERGTDEGAE